MGAAILELSAREVARRSLAARLTSFTPGILSLLVVCAIAGWALAAARSRRDVRSAPARAPLLLATLFAVGLALQLQLGARLQSDGFYYFAYLRSIVFDRDVNFVNDYTLLGLNDKPQLFTPTRTGHAQSAASIGPAILWAPFFAAGHLVARDLGARHPEIDANGISFPYRQSVCVASLFYGLIGCWFCFGIARRYFAPALAAFAVTITVTGSFLLWYLVKEPSMTHGPSMMAVAAFVWAWLATRDSRLAPGGGRKRASEWAWLGAIAGLMTLIRWQNALFAVLPAYDAIVALRTAVRTRDTDAAARALVSGLIFTACATIVFSPQLLAWHSIYGQWFAVSPIGPQLRWSDPHLVDILWSSRNGLFSWSPVLYLGAIGLLLFAFEQPAIGVPMVLVVALMTFFNSCIQDWWGSDGFGGRRFDGTIPFFTVGMGVVAVHAMSWTRRHPLRALSFGAAALVLWNLTLISAANEGVFRLGTTVSFGDTSAAQARAFHRWFGNPFTYPASLVFALRNGLPPARYDLLSANRFLGDPARPYGRVDVGADDTWLLEEGWHGPEHDGEITFRWAFSPAVVLIPLDHAAPLRVQVRLHSFGYPGAPPQTLTVSVNGHTFGPVPVHDGWETLEFATDADAWRSGVNRLRLEFAWVRSPAEAGLGGDARPLAAAVDYVRVQQRN